MTTPQPGRRDSELPGPADHHQQASFFDLDGRRHGGRGRPRRPCQPQPRYGSRVEPLEFDEIDRIQLNDNVVGAHTA